MIAATMFSGIGAPECAMPHWEWRWCAEIENFPRAVLAARHPLSVNLGDVNAEDFVARAESLGGRPDVIVFGSPCQDFSVAGRRVGLDGDRGNLALVALGIVNKLRPRWCVFENVPGLLSSRSGSAEAERTVREGPVGARADSDEDSDFAAFLSLVRECGYFGAYRISDAQYAGVPQRRRRIFAVFHLGDWRPAAAVLFEPEGLRGDHPPSRETGEGIAPTISSRPTGSGGLGTDVDLNGGLIARPLSAARGVASAHREDMETYVVADGPDGAVSSKWSKGSGGPAGDECYNLVAAKTFNNTGQGWWDDSDIAAGLRDMSAGGGSREATLVTTQLAFGGNNTQGPIDVATARNAHAGPAGRQDFETETFIVADLAPTLVAGGNKTGGTRYPGTKVDEAEGLIVTAFEDRVRGDDGRGYDREPNFVENISPALNTMKTPIISFDCKAGGETSFSVGDQAGALRASHGGGHAAVAINLRGREDGAMPEMSDVASLRSASGGSSRSFVFKPSHFTRGKDGQPSGVSPPLGAEPDKGDQDPILMTGTAVRRLTPRECERLQAFPDDYTLIKYRGAPASDGPRYKALGNAMNVYEVRWVLQRIERFEKEKATW